jgi:meiotically up-regulated gene 157 (Mug157) protein
VNQALQTHATAVHAEHGKIYAYEVDGFGNQLFMDDANVPSLLALPYLGCVAASHPTYQNTRRFVLGSNNPYFFRGKAAAGIGGPHVGLNMIWPLSIIMRGLTSNQETEIVSCLNTLIRTHAGTGFMLSPGRPQQVHSCMVRLGEYFVRRIRAKSLARA